MSTPPPNINEPMVPSAVNINKPPPVGETFLQNLSNVNFKDIPLVGTDTLGLNTFANNLQSSLVSFVSSWTGQSSSAATTTLNSFFASFNQLTNLLPTTFSSSNNSGTFIGALEKFLGGQLFKPVHFGKQSN